MRVISLYGEDFSFACKLLSDKVLQDFRPNAVVAILTGGGFVAKEMMKNFPSDSVNYSEIKIQRSGTDKKGNKCVKIALKSLPIFLLNWLRMFESVLLECKSKKEISSENIEFCAENIINLENPNILIVDDAIDSGQTMRLAKKILKEKFPSSEIKTAVITVTTNSPVADADYFLYRNRTLIRFPWSNDAKKQMQCKKP